MTAVRYDMNEGRNRPVRGDRPRLIRNRPRIGEYADPADCDHPIEARCRPIPDSYGYIARCHECGLHQQKYDRTTWEIAL